MDNTPICPESKLTRDERTECRWMGAVVAVWLIAVATLTGCSPSPRAEPERIQGTHSAPLVYKAEPSVLQSTDIKPEPGAPSLFATVANLKRRAYVFGTDSPELLETLQLAAQALNKAAGFQVAEVAAATEKADGIATTTVPEGIYAWTYGYDDGWCEMQLGAAVGDVDTAVHEMLHCLGVGHDNNPESLMYPDAAPGQKLTTETLDVLHQMHGE